MVILLNAMALHRAFGKLEPLPHILPAAILKTKKGNHLLLHVGQPLYSRVFA